MRAFCRNLFLLCLPIASVAQKIPIGPAIDAEVNKLMAATHANGLAVRSEAGFAGLVRFILGDTGVPMNGNTAATPGNHKFEFPTSGFSPAVRSLGGFSSARIVIVHKPA